MTTIMLKLARLTNFITLRIHAQPIKPSYSPSLCPRLCKYVYDRISGGSLGTEGLSQCVRPDLKYIFPNWFYFTSVCACALVRQYSWFLDGAYGIICRRCWLHHPCCLKKRCSLIFCHFYGGMVSFVWVIPIIWLNFTKWNLPHPLWVWCTLCCDGVD